MQYGSSNGSNPSSSESPVDEMPAAWVIVAKRTPREVIAATAFQSTMKPADGGSNATGGPAIGVQVSHSSSGDGRWAY